MRRHFQQRHINDSITIEEQGPLPQCKWCGFFGRNVESAAHSESAHCMRYAVKRRRYYKSRRQDHAKTVTFDVGGVTIRNSQQFRYLGRILDSGDDDNHAAL